MGGQWIHRKLHLYNRLVGWLGSIRIDEQRE